jgi:hypothetical protein
MTLAPIGMRLALARCPFPPSRLLHTRYQASQSRLLSTHPMATTSVSIKSGLLNMPGSTAASKTAVERCLTQDHQKNHCYYHPAGLHNHLSHHILAAYDMGASSELIGAIYDQERKSQRPVLLEGGTDIPKPGTIGETNWTEFLGNEK